MSGKYQIDMCRGPLFRQIILFSVPLILSFILQLLFNACDMIVIGRWSDFRSMAAIGATMNLNALLLNAVMGISLGANVLAAKYFGAKDIKNMSRSVHTAVALSLICGMFLAAVGIVLAKPVLIGMGTPEDVLPLSCTYVRIVFSSVPFILLYNFGCSILRAVGDTRRPFHYLIAAGTVNVLLNLFLVVVCGFDVAGVALATAASHTISALLVLRALIRSRGCCRLHLKHLRIDGAILKKMLWIGIPAGLQSSCFAVSNMLIQSSINSFGTAAIAGSTAACVLEGMVYVGSYAYHQTAVSFTAQNLGGGQYNRILKSLGLAMLCSTVFCFVSGFLFYGAGQFFLGIFNPDPDVIRWGMIRLKIMLTTYILCAMMDVSSGGLRGLGYSALSASISLVFICGLRAVWVLWFFPKHRTMEFLLSSYPVSWALGALLGSAFLFVLCLRLKFVKTGREVPWSKLGVGIPRGYRYLGRSK